MSANLSITEDQLQTLHELARLEHFDEWQRDVRHYTVRPPAPTIARPHAHEESRAIAMLTDWTKVSDRLPKPDESVLIANGEGIEIARYREREEDDPQQPGHDAGFIGTFAWPGRSWGNSLMSDPQGQPSHWMPLPEYPDFEEEEPVVMARESDDVLTARALSMLDDEQAFASFYRWRMAMECESAARSLREKLSVAEYVSAIFAGVPE